MSMITCVHPLYTSNNFEIFEKGVASASSNGLIGHVCKVLVHMVSFFSKHALLLFSMS
jgi:hypothetical protein